MIDHANRDRPSRSGLKIGGHQASCASMVSIMTSLWFNHLRNGDRVSVKPHASPVLHSINYLLGNLDESYMPRLREFGGLQSYPSRLKDPDPVDYSTGSVGIGATAPVWGALAHRYIASHFDTEGTGRQYSLLGDAELDEGACWEAIIDPMVSEFGELVWIVDLNRQSLDRVVPSIGAQRLEGMFTSAGWQVLTVKYGGRLENLFAQPGGEGLRARIDGMPNAEYQRLLRCEAPEVRNRLVGSARARHPTRMLLDHLSESELLAAVRDLGGHDLRALGRAFDAIDDHRPTVIFAYTIKGHGLATEGHPQNHSALLTADQLSALAHRVGADIELPWQRFQAGTPEADFCGVVAHRLRTDPGARSAIEPSVPCDLGRTPTGIATTQAALGRALLDLSRAAPTVGARVVTVSPDVSATTNLGGWVNRVGVWSPHERKDWFADDEGTTIRWRERPTGQHIELGISEVNLVGAISELGATWSRWGEPLLPIGVLYDPFVERALEPWSFGIYAGGQAVLVGTPSGISLAPEGGAHQSIKTPSIGLEQPGCVSYEPAFAVDTEWILLSMLGQLGKPDGQSGYLRLSTRPVNQALAAVPSDTAARERRRRHVIAGAYVLRSSHRPDLTICAMGAVVTEALDAAGRLTKLGFATDVLCITSPDLLFRAMQSRRGLGAAEDWVLNTVFGSSRAAPMVTLLDGHPHTLAFLAGINQVPATHLGVTAFGQSGDIDDMYRHFGLDAESVIGVALDLVD
ncbi:transketolase-like TK C-terminal-containing protein [Jatrophihabitans sp. DSM 45814]